MDRRDVASDLPAPLKPKAPECAAPLKPKASAAEVVHLTSRLVSRKSLLALQKMNALIDDPTEDAVLRPGDDDAALVARGILAGFLRRVRTDDVMLASYYRLLRFLVYVLAIVTVIAMQLGVFEGNTTVTYATVRDAIYHLSGEIIPNDAPGDIAGSVNGWDVYVDGVEAVIDAVFQEEACGDGLCSRTDEMPSWDPGEFVVGSRDGGAPRDFEGCASDCGAQLTPRLGGGGAAIHRRKSTAEARMRTWCAGALSCHGPFDAAASE